MGRKNPTFFIYENMLKSIATTRSDCTTKHKTKASYNTKTRRATTQKQGELQHKNKASYNTKTRRATTQTTLFLIGLTFFALIEKRLQHRLKKYV